MCTRLLYTVLPSPYTTQSFHRLLAKLTEDLNSLQEPGVNVPLYCICKLWFWPIAIRMLIWDPFLNFTYSLRRLRLNGKGRNTTSDSFAFPVREIGHFKDLPTVWIVATTAQQSVTGAMFEKLGCKSYQHIFWYLSLSDTSLLLNDSSHQKFNNQKGSPGDSPKHPFNHESAWHLRCDLCPGMVWCEGCNESCDLLRHKSQPLQRWKP